MRKMFLTILTCFPPIFILAVIASGYVHDSFVLVPFVLLFLVVLGLIELQSMKSEQSSFPKIKDKAMDNELFISDLLEESHE